MNEFLNWVIFYDRFNGIAFGDPEDGYFRITYTENGGISWNPIEKANLVEALADEYGVLGNFTEKGDKIYTSTNSNRILFSHD